MAKRGAAGGGGDEAEVLIPVERVLLEGTLALPAQAAGLVLFAHGSGSSRHSPRNRAVARVLQRAGLATLLFDLLTLPEERADAEDGHLRFDIGLLGRRLIGATRWSREDPRLAPLGVGYFGGSTGAAAAVVAAAQLPGIVGAVVARGGRVDLAAEALRAVAAPTLLIVGGNDRLVLDLNRRALAQLAGERELLVVPGATHLFEEPGALEQVAAAAAAWFRRHLGPAGTAAVRGA